MNQQIPEYYRGKNHFHKVIALHDEPSSKWEELAREIPLLTRGWFELARLSREDRLEFTREYWFAKLPFFSTDGVHQEERLNAFFDGIEDLGIFATQVTPSSPFDLHMIYSLREGRTFFHGSPPATAENIQTLMRQFAHINFPPDYLAFLQVHDGFSKVTDTGIIRTRDMARTFQHFQQLLGGDIVVSAEGQVVNPSSLIPFYESLGLHCYQCFYADWYPDEEMGNVFFSETDRSMSHFLDRNHLEENLAFMTFIDWLLFYLEDIWQI